jgi:hypothetical protein
MTDDPRAALTTLVSAFERHLEACSARRGEDDPTVLASADDLADAFEAYDDALLAAYGEMTPLEVYGDDDDEDDDDLEFDDDDGEADGELDDHADEDEDEATYSGFDGDFEYEGEGEPAEATPPAEGDVRG